MLLFNPGPRDQVTGRRLGSLCEIKYGMTLQNAALFLKFVSIPQPGRRGRRRM